MHVCPEKTSELSSGNTDRDDENQEPLYPDLSRELGYWNGRDGPIIEASSTKGSVQGLSSQQHSHPDVQFSIVNKTAPTNKSESSPRSNSHVAATSAPARLAQNFTLRVG